MQDPILELRALGEFIASILKGGDEIVTVETNASTLPTSSQYFSTILNPEPATQEHLDTETAVGQHGGGSSGFEELLEAAGYGSGLSKSLSPIREAKRELSVLEDAGSPSYSPLSSPSFSVDTLVKPFSVSSMRPGEPSSDVSSSILLKPSSLYDTKASTAPRGTPQWKIDLSERKGHRIEILHVGSRELDTLAKCLTLVHSATEKGEECMRAIIDRKDLAAEMQPEYEQWEECCADLENNVRIDEREAREHMKEDRAKGSAIYGAEAFGPDAYEGDDWFGTADSRDYGRLDPNDAQDTWGYRKVDAPSFTAKASRRRRDGSATYTYTDPDETEDEYEQGYKHRGAPRDFGMGSTFPAERGFGTGSPMSVGSHRSSGTEGVEEVRNFEEAFEEGGGGDGLDQEMMDVGEGEGDGEDLKQGKIIAKEEEEEGGDGDGKEGGNGKKGLTSGGGRTIGLYGELL